MLVNEYKLYVSIQKSLKDAKCGQWQNGHYSIFKSSSEESRRFF
jgi:hypothetical protein